MAKSDRYKVVYIRKNGQKLKRWKDTHTGKILVSRPWGGGELGVGSGKKLTNNKKVNKKVTQTQNKNWGETHKENIEKLKSGSKSAYKSTVDTLKSLGKKKTSDSNSSTESSSSSSSPNNEKLKSTKMHSIERKNREIHGGAAVDRLKQKHKEWKKARKEGKLDEWRKKWKKKK